MKSIERYGLQLAARLNRGHVKIADWLEEGGCVHLYEKHTELLCEAWGPQSRWEILKLTHESSSISIGNLTGMPFRLADLWIANVIS